MPFTYSLDNDLLVYCFSKQEDAECRAFRCKPRVSLGDNCENTHNQLILAFIRVCKWSQSPTAIGDGRSGPCSRNGERIINWRHWMRSVATSFVTQRSAAIQR
jgi:hypothetical protein